MKALRTAGRVLAEGASGTLRTLRHAPGFAATVVGVLALGVGANSVTFSILDRLLLSPPAHVLEPEAVRRVTVARPDLGGGRPTADMAYPDYRDFDAHSGLQAVAAFRSPAERTLGSGREARRVRAGLASHGFFPLLGVRPASGRFYGEEEDRVGAPPTAVLGHEFWTESMGADPDAIGRDVLVGGHEYRVIGVAPAEFTGIDLEPVDVWLPLETAEALEIGPTLLRSRDFRWVRAVARLAAGVTPEAAAVEATVLHRNGRRDQLGSGYPSDVRILLEPIGAARGPDASGEARVALWIGGVSLLVLLIACANVAGLLLARGTARRREVAVRLALGVGRRRLVATRIVEALLLALLGGAAAVLLNAWGGALVRSLLLPDVLFPRGSGGPRVLVFTACCAALAGLVAGAGPALQATRGDAAGALHAGAAGSGSPRSRVRTGLGVLQAALSVVLLVGAGLFLRSLERVRTLDLGLDVDQVLLAEIEFAEGGGFPVGPNAPEFEPRNRVYTDALDRLGALPGVVSAAATTVTFQHAIAAPLALPGIDSLPRLPGGRLPDIQEVTPGYFATVGQEMMAGRDLRGAAAGEPVVVVNETMARGLWPTEDALGRTLLLGDERRPFTVIGVAEDASRGQLREEPYMAYWIPFDPERGLNLGGIYVRTARAGAGLAAAVRDVVLAAGPSVRWVSVERLRDELDPQARAWTLGATLFTAFGALALILAAAGLYGTVAFDVTRRTREIGIRAALGAGGGRLVWVAMRAAAATAAAGAAIGLAVAWAVAPWMRDLLFDVAPRDPLVLGWAAAVLMAAAGLGALTPALRAARVDPMRALRVD